MSKGANLTKWLEDFSQGNEKAMEKLAPMVYRELRKMATNQLRRERSGHTLQPTALVNEVFIKMMEASSIRWEDRSHFFSMAAQIMRRILINHAEAKNRIKRGGGAVRVTFDESVHQEMIDSSQLLHLDEALTRLALKNERQARVVELRYFAGLTVEEIAEVLKTSVATVKRDWIFARAWLHRELSKGK